MTGNPPNDNIDTRPVLLMAGGTGGHVFPALAIATALKAKNIPVHWLGTRQGLEARVVPNTGIDISYLDIGGLRGKGKLALLRAPFKILIAMFQALFVVWRIKPRAVLGMGGFAAGPGGLAAWLLRKPLYIHEQNATPGLTNRILAPRAKLLMEAFPGAFDEKYQAVHTGNPLRFDILDLETPQPRIINQPPRILIMGGSQGAQTLNHLLPVAIEKMRQRVSIWHQTGRQYEGSAPTIAGIEYKMEPFIDNMGLAYDWADIVVCRSGALTVSEIAQVGLPSVLIPYPHAVDDHQTANASFLADAGAAILMPQTDLTAESLAEQLDQLVIDLPRMQQMSSAARRCARPDALMRVVEIITEQTS